MVTKITMATGGNGGVASMLRRAILLLAVAALMAAMVVALGAGPAMAKTSGEQPQGPPLFTAGSSGRAAVVVHCGAEKAGGTRGVLLANSNGKHTNNCDAQQLP